MGATVFRFDMPKDAGNKVAHPTGCFPQTVTKDKKIKQFQKSFVKLIENDFWYASI